MAGSSAVKAGEGFLELFLKSDKLHAGLTSASKKIATWSAGLGGAGASIAAVSGAVLAPILGMVTSTANAGDALRDMSMRTGVTVEALSELGYAAELSGNDLEGIEGAITNMQKTLGGGKGDKALKAIGLSLRDIQGLSPDKQLEVIGGAISAIEDPAKRTTAWLAIFGKTGTKLAPMFEQGAEGVRAMREELAAMGGTTTQEAADAADTYNDALSKLGAVLGVVKRAIGNTLIPVITEMIGQATEIAMPLAKWVSENKELIITIFKVASVGAVIGTVLVGLGSAGLMLSGVLIGLKTILIGVAAVIGFIASPIGLVVAGIAGLIAGFIYVTGLSATLIKAFHGITAALMGGKWGLAGSIMMKSLEIAWVSGVLMLKSVWIDFKHWFFQTFDEIAAYSKGMWERIVDQVAVEIIGLQGLLDKTFDSQAAMAEIGKDQKRRESEPSAANKNATREKNEELEKINQRLADAKRELDDLIAKASGKAKKKFLPYDTSTLGPKKAAMAPTALASSGTFSGFAARLLGRSAPSVNERIAKASEETNEKLDELLEAVKAGGGEFAQ